MTDTKVLARDQFTIFTTETAEGVFARMWEGETFQQICGDTTPLPPTKVMANLVAAESCAIGRKITDNPELAEFAATWSNRMADVIELLGPEHDHRRLGG